MTRTMPRKTKRQRIFERDDNRCVFCGTSEDLTIDHIVPKSKGGKNNNDNLQTLCKPCNLRKGAFLKEELNRPRIVEIKPVNKNDCPCDCHNQKGWNQSTYGVCCWQSNHSVMIRA